MLNTHTTERCLAGIDSMRVTWRMCANVGRTKAIKYSVKELRIPFFKELSGY